MEKITITNLHLICANRSESKLLSFIDPLNKILDEYGINTSLRVQHFLAQACHETCEFKYLKELASGEAYEGRKDLGNVNKSDGVKFKGRGIFQTTGRANYLLTSKALFGDDRLLNNPDLLCEVDNAIRSACYYWQGHNLSVLADKDDVLSISKKINGVNRKTGLPNGLDSRKHYLDLAKKYIK